MGVLPVFTSSLPCPGGLHEVDVIISRGGSMKEGTRSPTRSTMLRTNITWEVLTVLTSIRSI